jgi:hypothetical protein
MNLSQNNIKIKIYIPRYMNQYILEIYHRIRGMFEWIMFRTGPSDKDSDDGDIEQQEEQTILLYRESVLES